MPEDRIKVKGTRKKIMGSVRARASLSAKAGYRKTPSTRGKHITTPEQRARGRWLSTLGLTPTMLDKIDAQVDDMVASRELEKLRSKREAEHNDASAEV